MASTREAPPGRRAARSSTSPWLMLGLLLPVAMSTGCGTAIKRVYYEFRGAKAKVHPTGPVSIGAFDRFNSVEFSPVTTDSGELCPPELLAAYDSAAQDMSASIRGFEGGPTALRIESDMLYFQGSGVFKTALCLVRVRMFDDARLVQHAIVTAESKSVTRDAAADLPKACAKALREYLAKQRSREGDEDDEDR